MSEENVTRIRMKVETLNCFQNTIDHINSLTNQILTLDPAAEVQFCASDIGFNIILGYLEDIAKRSIELNDPRLLELCEGLRLISKEKDKNDEPNLERKEPEPR